VSYEIPGFSWTAVAGQDLTLSQFCAVDLEYNTGEAVLPSEGGRAVGVLRNHPDDEQSAVIVSTGIVLAKIGIAGIKAGDNVTVDSNGTILPASSGDALLGVALQTKNAGELGTILLLNGVAAAAGS
jgi:hypothetical protein